MEISRFIFEVIPILLMIYIPFSVVVYPLVDNKLLQLLFWFPDGLIEKIFCKDNLR